MIKHKWKEIDARKHCIETHECVVCGCLRDKFWEPGMPYPHFLYVRNGIIFTEGRPECYPDEPDFQHAMGEFND
jgi:hypothetical protein